MGDFIPWLSDHSPIFTDIALNTDTKTPNTPITLNERDQGYIWDDDCEEAFKNILLDDKINLENINELTRQNSDANELAKKIKNSILEASKKCNLKKRKQTKHVKSKPWFDKECSDLKRKLTEIGTKLRNDKGNVELRK